MLALTTTGQDIAPEWTIGVISGLGGLCGSYLGAHLQPVLPEKALRAGLGVLAVATAAPLRDPGTGLSMTGRNHYVAYCDHGWAAISAWRWATW